MTKTGIAGSIDLLALKGSQVIMHEEMEGVFIPFRRKKGLQKIIRKNGNAMAALSVFLLPKEDNYGNDYMVSRGRTKEENEDKVYSEVLGNLKEIRKGEKFGGPDPDNDRNTPPPKRGNSEESPF